MGEISDLPVQCSVEETHGCNGNVNNATKKLRYCKWRSELKKQKRKSKRKTLAQLRDAIQSEEPGDETILEEDRSEEERERQSQNELWLERERLAQENFRKQKEEEERLRQEAEQRKLNEAEAAEQRKVQQEELKRKLEQNKKKANATPTKQKQSDTWQNPPAPPDYNAEHLEVKSCPFFQKVGSCRFGINCKRAHIVPESSTTLLFPGMFTHFELEQCYHDDSDLTLEYEEGEIYEEFKLFYDEVLPEFLAIGRVINFVVCCNYEPHLRGNVYVQYARC